MVSASSKNIMQTIDPTSFPPAVQTILKRFHEENLEIYVVGGAVRDHLLGFPIHDWDFTTNATPEQILTLFPDGFYDNTFGTVGIAHKHLAQDSTGDTAPTTDITATTQTTMEESSEIYEITTFRSDGVYEDHRRPSTVTWGDSLLHDLERRDFTINAMAIDQAGEIHDPFGGQQDLEQRLVRAVGDPETRFQEDALRMLRAIRIASQLSFQIDSATLSAITAQHALIQHTSWERIREEFLKILVTDHPADSINLLASTGMLEHILPELLEGRGVEQAHHHIYDVWTHSLQAVEHCPSKDPIVRFATLLHDVAKPRTANLSTGTVTFHNHEVVGARMAKEIASRFRLSKQDIQRVFGLVRWHMFVYDSNVTDAYIRRFIKRVGVENIPDIIALRTGDRVGSGAKATSWRLEEMKDRIQAQLHQPFSLKDLKINGDDLMKELQLQPGPILGKLLQALFEVVIEDPEKNTKDILINEAKSILENTTAFDQLAHPKQ